MEDATYTVAGLARAVGRAVARAFPDDVWVQGEIRDLSRASSGHVYFTLLDSDDEGAPAALPVTLFESDKVAVNRVLARSGAVRMTDGIEVRIRGRVGHYAARGTIQLRMTWIDPDFTLGKLAAARDRLVKSLKKRGLVDRNPALAIPLVPLRVGLITSDGSAAAADFLDELSRSGYAWEIALFDARVQGVEAVSDVVRGLRVLGPAQVDVVALVRGGGAQTDLAVFDSEDIAVAIAECPKPVFTGIGHETDISVADLVARSYKTPTACAAGLVGVVSGFVRCIDESGLATRRAVLSQLALATSNVEHSSRRISRSAVAAGARERQRLTEAGRRISRGSQGRLLREQISLEGVRRRIWRAGSRQTTDTRIAVDRITESVAIAARRSTAQAKSKLAEVQHRIGLLEPARLLARGWSITRTADGVLVIQPRDVAAGTKLLTTVAGGRIASVVDDNGEVGRD
jgi:exodeoxyribonuclease VII large subunit